ncbi:hypothetical protein pkur_cds_61 [Pandoravirus kuranda]|uniref:Uncharacterized protein n=1 Tax=Pandoravirus kuranda TaxID=3019033 RepID=A0AA95J777_9VIRU|nr:hypothetical protein pkur_cds_61 [Pandoravirus kuranda]
MQHDHCSAAPKPVADPSEARLIILAFVNDPDAEDRYNEGVLDRVVGPLFASPGAAPAECSLHPNPSDVCYERFHAAEPWRAARCLRAPREPPSATAVQDEIMTDSWRASDNTTPAIPCQKSSGDGGAQADAPQATLGPAVGPEPRGKSGWATFCGTTCASMRHPNFRLLWRYGSSRKGTLLENVDEDAPLVVADDTFLMAVHRACIDALPDAVADASFAKALFAAARKIGERLDRMHGVRACAVAPCADARRWSTSRLASESDVVLAFCDALAVWRDSSSWYYRNMDDHEARAMDRVAWASGATSAQEAVDLLLAYEEAECRESARLLLAPRVAGPFVVVSCGEQVFARDEGRYPDDTEAILKRHRVGSHWVRTWVDEAHVSQLLADTIRAGGSALAKTSITFGGAQGPNACVVIRADEIVSSPLARATYRALHAWSIGPSLLTTEAALCALEIVLARRPEYARGIPDQVAALAVARRAMDALYVDQRVRTTVIHKAIVDRADALWTRRNST